MSCRRCMPRFQFRTSDKRVLYIAPAHLHRHQSLQSKLLKEERGLGSGRACLLQRVVCAHARADSASICTLLDCPMVMLPAYGGTRRGDSCSALRIRKPFFGYQRDFEEDLRGTPNVALRPLAAPLGAYVYEISQAAWPDLSIERTQQCTRQVFLGGARTRTGQLIRDDDEERSKRSLSDRLSTFSVIRHNLTSLKTNRVVSAYAHPASIRHWVAHAEMAQRLKGDLTTATMVPIDTPDGSAERPEALLDLPAWLLELDDEDEEEEDEEEEEEDKDEEEDDEEEEEDDEEDMEDVYVDVFELPSEADFDLDDTERETIAEYQRKRRLDLEDPPISPDEFLTGSSSSSSQVLSDDLDHMDYEEWEDLLAC